MLFYSLARPARRVAGHRASSVMPPRGPSSNETWIVEAGGEVVELRARAGAGSLTPRQEILYWLWWADYMMRNAGDFANAVGDKSDFQQKIVSRAKELGLSYTEATFSLPRDQLQKQYFGRFEAVCDEITGA
jgi:hypothetical protein